MVMIKVVCGLIFKEDKIFICRRKPEKSLGGFWEFPGGKVELNEELEASLIRELREELQMSVEVKEHFKTVKHNYDNFSIELISFICEFENSNYILTDHDSYEWLDPKELLKWKLAPADIPIARALIS